MSFILWARINNGPPIKITEGTMAEVRGDAVARLGNRAYTEFRVALPGQAYHMGEYVF